MSMMKSCDACVKRVNEVRNFYGANVCRKCATDLKEAFDGPETMRSSGVRSKHGDEHADASGVPYHWPELTLDDIHDDFGDEMAPDTERDSEACPGCGSMPGDGITNDCDDPMGCGHNRMNQDTAIGDAIAQTQRSPSHMKHESAKFNGDTYMEETLRLEEAKNRLKRAPLNQESIGHIRQLRTQESPSNRIKIGK